MTLAIASSNRKRRLGSTNGELMIGFSMTTRLAISDSADAPNGCRRVNQPDDNESWGRCVAFTGEKIDDARPPWSIGVVWEGLARFALPHCAGWAASRKDARGSC